jgi:hypothetical protein
MGSRLQWIVASVRLGFAFSDSETPKIIALGAESDFPN